MQFRAFSGPRIPDNNSHIPQRQARPSPNSRRKQQIKRCIISRKQTARIDSPRNYANFSDSLQSPAAAGTSSNFFCSKETAQNEGPDIPAEPPRIICIPREIYRGDIPRFNCARVQTHLRRALINRRARCEHFCRAYNNSGAE